MHGLRRVLLTPSCDTCPQTNIAFLKEFPPLPGTTTERKGGSRQELSSAAAAASDYLKEQEQSLPVGQVPVFMHPPAHASGGAKNPSSGMYEGAKEKAQQMSEKAKEVGAGVYEGTKERVQQASEKAKEKAKQVYEAAKGRL